jgi:hypothetical protein
MHEIPGIPEEVDDKPIIITDGSLKIFSENQFAGWRVEPGPNN